METEIRQFMEYLAQEKHASKNTQMSYRRDLSQMWEYLREQGITDPAKVTKTLLNSYILYLEKQGKATTTISRMLAAIKAFFHFEFCQGKIRKDPAQLLKAPKVEKKAPTILGVEEVVNLLNQPDGGSPKELRDKAMLELLYATGIRVSELIGLKLEDMNLPIGFITCRDEHKERTVPFGKMTRQALEQYLEQGRGKLLKGKQSQWLFVNCSGSPMSRQGFWKIIKHYGEKAGIATDITPHTLRHSFAAHLIGGGADIRAVQTMMGHSDMATTQAYAAYIQKEDSVRTEYSNAHPRQ
ncbi:MAG: tyrosine recombinase XerD [Hungatella sp.]|nr:tyrosine recombinase XerD [Hungatella sp.]